MKQTESNKVNLITKKLDDACIIDFGTRVVQKKDGGNIYPVYGGGGATFKVNTYNRENCLVVSRFAMSKQCTRFVEGKFYLNDSGLTVRTKNEKELAQKYLDYLLLTLNDTIYSLSRGTAQRNLNVSKFRNLIINYPDSIELQLHIANLLSKAENLIAQRKESIRLLDEFLKSTFLEMFGDVTQGRNKRKLEGFLNLIGGAAFKSGDFKKEGVPVIKIGTVNKGYFDTTTFSYLDESFRDSHSKYIIKNGDLLLSLTGTVGKDDYGNTCFANSGFSSYLLNQRVAKIVVNPEVLNLQFIHFLFKYPPFKSLVIRKNRGVRQANISNSDIYSIQIRIPNLELQTQFARIVEKTEALKSQYQQSLQELEQLYGSLSQKAFRGELSIYKPVSV